MGGVKKFPNFELNHSSSNCSIDRDDEDITFLSGNLKADSNKNKFAINFCSDEKKITKADSESLSWIEGTNDKTDITGHLNLAVGEKLYGIGERFTPFVKNGQSVDIWNKDG